MRSKTMAILTALAFSSLAPVAAQDYEVEAEAQPAIESEVVAETQPAIESETGVEPTPEPIAPEAVELDAAEVPEPDAEDSTALQTEAEGFDELPRTASPLALLALLGIGSAASALGLRSVRRK